MNNLQTFSILLLLIIFKTDIASGYVNCKERNETEATAKNVLRRLLLHLRCNYDLYTRPVNDTNQIVLGVKMEVYAIDVYFEKDLAPQFEVHNRLSLKWTDDRLKWDLKDFDLKMTPIPARIIWMPDLLLYNGINESDEDKIYADVCTVTYTGEVECIIPNQLNALCIPNYKNWPFNTEICETLIGAWAPGVRFQFIGEGYNLENYRPHNEWDLTKIESGFTYENGSTIAESIPYLHYQFYLKHHSAMHKAVLIVPLIVFIVMNLVGILIDPLSHVRIVLIGANIFLHTGYLEEIVTHGYVGGTTSPLITVLYRNSLFLTLAMLLVTLIIVKLHNIRVNPPPGVHKVLALILDNQLIKTILDNTANRKANNSRNGTNDEILSQGFEMWVKLGKLLDLLLFGFAFNTYIVFIMRFLPSETNK